MHLNQITLPAVDVGTSVAFYQRLGFTLIVDARPTYARFECPDGGTTFSLHQVARAAQASGVVVYFECEDLDTRVTELVTKGIAFARPPTDESWLWREARLLDPSENELCLYWAGTNRRFPPWRLQAATRP